MWQLVLAASYCFVLLAPSIICQSTSSLPFPAVFRGLFRMSYGFSQVSPLCRPWPTQLRPAMASQPGSLEESFRNPCHLASEGPLSIPKYDGTGGAESLVPVLSRQFSHSLYSHYLLFGILLLAAFHGFVGLI